MIEIKNMFKYFEDYMVLEDISCSFEEGNIYGIVGINGAGKSTLIRHIAGVYECDGGEVLYNGKPIYENVNAKRDIIFFSDSPYFFHNYSINDTKSFLSTFYEFDNELYNKLLKNFSLDPNKSINKFSKGMKKQSELLLGLCCNPKVLLLDETFDGLDPIITQKVKSLLVELVEEKGLTVIISSHNLLGLDFICDYIYLLDKNRISIQKDINDSQSLFKIQVYFPNRSTEEVIALLKDKIEIVDYKEVGSVLNLVVKGLSYDIKEKVMALSPALFDVLQFTFEERFIYEVGGDDNGED